MRTKTGSIALNRHACLATKKTTAANYAAYGLFHSHAPAQTLLPHAAVNFSSVLVHTTAWFVCDAAPGPTSTGAKADMQPSQGDLNLPLVIHHHSIFVH